MKPEQIAERSLAICGLTEENVVFRSMRSMLARRVAMNIAKRLSLTWKLRPHLGGWCCFVRGSHVPMGALGGRNIGSIVNSIASHIIAEEPLSPEAKCVLSYDAIDIVTIGLLEYDYPLLAADRHSFMYVKQMIGYVFMNIGMPQAEMTRALKVEKVHSHRLNKFRRHAEAFQSFLLSMNGEPIEQFYTRPGGRETFTDRKPDFAVLGVPVDIALQKARDYRRAVESRIIDGVRSKVESRRAVVGESGDVYTRAAATINPKDYGF